MTESISISDLASLQGASRYARSYSFLYAAFRQNEGQTSLVRDTLDCLILFVTAYTNSVAGTQLDIAKLQSFINERFSFSIPIYALQEILPSLSQRGFLNYDKRLRVYIATRQQDTFSVAKSEIQSDFDLITKSLGRYAASIGFTIQPSSGSWDEAIVNFLRPSNFKLETKFINLKSTLIDPKKIEGTVVASFISELYETNRAQYDAIVRVFLGTLIEDFLSSVSEVGKFDRSNRLVILYDTSIILRLLGCSGKLLNTATQELTRYLQDIGCDIAYLPGNENEVNNIIQTIVSLKDSGKEIEGETAAAISSGEVNITELRMLQNNFANDLARDNIFPFEEPPLDQKQARLFQINELGFSEHLAKAAFDQGRSYGHANRENDAQYLATVMRLRRGVKTRDMASARFVFVTSNFLLANASRQYLIKEKTISYVHFPPILTVTQLTTIAWLLKDKKLVPDKAGRELLTNCYAAVRPDAEWFRYFREGMERVVGNLDNFVQSGENAFVLQAARRIAQEQSFSSASILRQVNTAEIIEQSRRMYNEEIAGIREKQAEEVERSVKEAQAKSILQSNDHFTQHIEERCLRYTTFIVDTMKAILRLLF